MRDAMDPQLQATASIIEEAFEKIDPQIRAYKKTKDSFLIKIPQANSADENKPETIKFFLREGLIHAKNVVLIGKKWVEQAGEWTYRNNDGVRACLKSIVMNILRLSAN